MLKPIEKIHPSKPEVDTYRSGCEAGRLAGRILVAELRARVDVLGSGLLTGRAIEAAGRHVGRFGAGYRTGLASILEQAIAKAAVA